MSRAALDINTHIDVFAELGAQSKTPRRRTIRQFAEQEIVIPNGKYQGRRFRCEYQPYAGLAFDQMDSGLFKTHVFTGPTQSGKTMSTFLIPLVHCLFELRETAVVGVPNLDMISDKWSEDIKPVIEATRFREYLPRKGRGSRGGTPQRIDFLNGASMRFMTGGGDDKTAAAFTARNLYVTETDGMDEAGETSREADRVSQLIGRTRAFGNLARIFMECTVSTRLGRTWREYEAGTASTIVFPCVHCGEYVRPEREDFHGWDQADNEIDAGERAYFACPKCAGVIDQAAREQMVKLCRLIHKGQTISADGVIEGPRPKTLTLGFRWSAFENMFLTLKDLASDAYKAATKEDTADAENSEKEQKQFVWCVPYDPPKIDISSLTLGNLMMRMHPEARGVVPDAAEFIVGAIDIGRHYLHWKIVAACPDGPRIVDYLISDCPSNFLGTEKAIFKTLEEIRELMIAGWPCGDRIVYPVVTLIDSGWMDDVVFSFIEKYGPPFWASKGLGQSLESPQRYVEPKATGNLVQHVGNHWHVVHLEEKNVLQVQMDADHWKHWLQDGLAIPVGQQGAITVYSQENPKNHRQWAAHMTSEKYSEKFDPGRGWIGKWEKTSQKRHNHWLDCGYMSGVALELARLMLAARGRRAPVAAAGVDSGDDSFVARR
ncbi:MAG: hypothetical protein AMXMBFR84_37740 [Candidatus Hydrogenedentota bacterium]